MESTMLSDSEAAEHIGVSVNVLRLWAACGMAGAPWDYSPRFKTVAELARWFGISERTAHSWKVAGMPVESDGTYSQLAVLNWRRQRPKPEPWHATGNRALSPKPATGDLVRAIYRTQRTHLLEAMIAIAVEMFPKEDKHQAKLIELLAKHLRQFMLDDADIEQLLIEAWPSM